MGQIYIGILFLFILGVVIILAAISAWLKQRNIKLGERAVEDVFMASQYRNRPEQRHVPHNDFLARNKLLEEKKRKELAERGVTKYYPNNAIAQESQMEAEIVGIVQPKGFWTRFIMSQKMGYIMARLNFRRRSGGRWVNFIAAQGSQQGKDQTRGR